MSYQEEGNGKSPDNDFPRVRPFVSGFVCGAVIFTTIMSLFMMGGRKRIITATANSCNDYWLSQVKDLASEVKEHCQCE